MRLATYFDEGPTLGLVEGSEIWNLRGVVSRYLFETERLPDGAKVAATLVPNDMAMFIRLNGGRLDYFRDALGYIIDRRQELGDVDWLAKGVDKVRLLPPVLKPRKILCCGSAYRDYVIELGRTPDDPKWPVDVKISFLKQPSALIGHKDTILYPPDSEEYDYENELAIIIGDFCSDISESEARRYIFGYSVFNDACIRDLPSYSGGLESPRGKSIDTVAPCGPWIVPAADLGKDPNDLDFTTKVDGDLRQEGNTSGLLWPIERIVSVAARYVRLSPGDIIATGSTKGNALSNGKYLKAGQKVVCEIEGIGRLENMVGQRKWTGNVPARVAR